MSTNYLLDSAIIKEFYKFIKKKLNRKIYDVFIFGDAEPIIRVNYRGFPYEVLLTDKFEVVIYDLTTNVRNPEKMEKVRKKLEEFCKDKVFEVNVRKTSISFNTFFVWAENGIEAKRKALKEASDYEFTETDSEFNVNYINKISKH